MASLTLRVTCLTARISRLAQSGGTKVSNSQLPIFLNRALYKMYEGHLTHNFLLISQTKILSHVDRKVNVNEKILPKEPPVFLKHMIFIQKLMAQKIVKLV